MHVTNSYYPTYKRIHVKVLKIYEVPADVETWPTGHTLIAVRATMSHSHSGSDNHVEISNDDYIVIQKADFQSLYNRL